MIKRDATTDDARLCRAGTVIAVHECWIAIVSFRVNSDSCYVLTGFIMTLLETINWLVIRLSKLGNFCQVLSKLKQLTVS